MNDTQNNIEMAPLRRPLIVSCSKQSRRSHWLNNNDSNESTRKVTNRTGNLNDSVIEEYFFANKDLKISSHQPVQEEHKKAEDWVMISKDETRNGKYSSSRLLFLLSRSIKLTYYLQQQTSLTSLIQEKEANQIFVQNGAARQL